ncbi:MAG TPA: cellulose-binding protein, partial [Trebonia sp.]|nr:cellulose-binding protein [Trebonia sp.]
ERERDDIVRAARREADEIRRREQFLLEQSESLRSQAEADLEVELADRRAEAERLEEERLADAQEATRKLVEEAERRAADAEKRAADATAQAEQARRDAEADARKELADAHRKAELIIAQAKDDGKDLLVAIEVEADKRRAAIQKELDELTRQKKEVDGKLAQMRQLFAAGPILDTPAG